MQNISVLNVIVAAWTTSTTHFKYDTSRRPTTVIGVPKASLQKSNFYYTDAADVPSYSSPRRQTLSELHEQRTENPQQRRWGRFRFSKSKAFDANNSKISTTTVSSASSGSSVTSDSFRWTFAKALQAVVVFVLAGIAEIGGGWLVWMAVRERKPWWWALLGSIVLVLYGFIPTLQPTDSFGRIYAVYGGFFIALSYAWGWKFDGMKPDLGDIIGGSLALCGVLIVLFWPRQQ